MMAGVAGLDTFRPNYIVHVPNYRGNPTHPHNRTVAGVAGFGKLLLVATLAVDALLLEDKHCVLQLLLTTGADKVFGVPAPTHGGCIWSPAYDTMYMCVDMHR